jgi:aspartyl-tRNA(Asn)/glutamyl-tRNA(Gln) amidotransferase subunit A
MDDQNLPIGLQIMAPAFAEEKLLRIARMYEAQTQWHTKKPPMIDK